MRDANNFLVEILKNEWSPPVLFQQWFFYSNRFQKKPRSDWSNTVWLNISCGVFFSRVNKHANAVSFTTTFYWNPRLHRFFHLSDWSIKLPHPPQSIRCQLQVIATRLGFPIVEARKLWKTLFKVNSQSIALANFPFERSVCNHW